MFRGPGPSALALVIGVLLVLNGALGVLDDSHESLQEHKDEDYHKISERLDEVTARLERIDHHLDKRLSPKIRQKALSLEHRVSKLEEDHCDKDHYDCGGQDHQCVSRLKVCDGHRDCRNGEDEKHCKLPTNTGDKFIGYKVYDNCDNGHVDKVNLVITTVQVRPAFPGFPKVRVVLSGVDKSHVERNEMAFHLVGYYRFSTNKLVLFAPPGLETSEGYAIICEFDGHDQDRCVARVVNKGSLSSCAEFVFFREKRHDHDHH
jgi:hypothetical protein